MGNKPITSASIEESLIQSIKKDQEVKDIMSKAVLNEESILIEHSGSSSINERIKQVRRSLQLSQEQFAKTIGITKGAISKLESTSANVTDQMTKAICREFNVDYMWFTSGEGDMFIEDDLYERVDKIIADGNPFHHRLLKAIARLNDQELAVLEKIADNFLADAEEK